MQRNIRLQTLVYTLSILCLSLVITGCTLVLEAEMFEEKEKPHWGYEGEINPENWSEIDDGFQLCGSGEAQSPIDITEAIPIDLKPITFDYQEVPMAIFNNGHTIEVEYAEGSQITYNEKVYDVLQFHFHHPSEHTINGEAAAMEIHIVHKDVNSGNLAVVGVMLMIGEEENAAYSTLFDNLPAGISTPDQATALMINVADLLPENSNDYFTYEGSLTTPPCSEIVRWLVMTEPVLLSQSQIDSFGAIFSANARPTQPLNERDLLDVE